MGWKNGGADKYSLQGAARSGLYKAIVHRRLVRGIICRRAVDYHREYHSG